MAWPTTRASDCVATLPSSLETASTGNSTRPSVPVTSFSTRTTSPGATRYCFPPARITAYIRLPPKNVVEIQPVNEVSNRTFMSDPRRTRAQPRGLLISYACCVFRPGASSSHGRRPQNGSASTVKLHYSSVRCGNRSNGIEWTSTLSVRHSLFSELAHLRVFGPPEQFPFFYTFAPHTVSR